jgi:uncharacterized membrane protein
MTTETLWRRCVWALNDASRAGVCFLLGGFIFVLAFRQGLSWEIAFLSGWNLGLAAYLALLGAVVFNADETASRERLSKVDPTEISLVTVLVLVAILGIMAVGVILTAVGQRSSLETKLLISLSVIAVTLNWMLLHTAFGQHYARLYYDEPEGMSDIRRGFDFPGTSSPTYADFMYVSFTIGLTYAMSDVSVTDSVERRTVLVHGIVSFFFYSTVFGAVLNAVVTS